LITVKELWLPPLADERLEDEGKADQGKANIKQAGEKIKDAAKNIFKN